MKKNCGNCKYLDFEFDDFSYRDFPVCTKYPLESLKEERTSSKMQKISYFNKSKKCCSFILSKCKQCKTIEVSHRLINNHCYNCADFDE